MIRFEDVKDQSTEEYFEGNQFSIDAFNRKYTIHEGETYPQAIWRVCQYVAQAEKTPELQQYWAERWFDEIYNDWWQPAGSIMQGSGSGKKISMFNCTHISLGGNREDEEWDSLEAIIKNAGYTVAKTAAYRQGLGIDFSRLRPAGSRVLNSANFSTGSIHWMMYIDSMASYVGQKGRIPAMLFSLSCSHPDVYDFVKSKADRHAIQNANISVQCTDAFYQAVENDGDWTLEFHIPETKKGQKVYIDVNSGDMAAKYDERRKKWYYVARKDRPGESITKVVKARELMELIAKYMRDHGEPGVQNIDIARRFSNSDYVYDPHDEYDSRIVGTNACSEQYLSADSCCDLASVNAGKFSTDPERLEQELMVIGPSILRFLDNVNEMELREGTYVTPRQKVAIEKLRRVGAGFTNLCAWLFRQGLEYASPAGNRAAAQFMDIYNRELYKASIALGHEKGSFGLFDQKKFEKSPFVQGMIKRHGLKFTAMRNCTCSSLAPTGTLSLMFRGLVLSYGGDGGFGIYYWKRTRMKGEYEFYFCVPRVVRDWFAEKGFPIPMDSDCVKDTWDGKHGKDIVKFIEDHRDEVGITFTRASDINLMGKMDLIAQLMPSVDSSMSTTFMLPEDASWEVVYDFIMEGWRRGVKSMAAFPDKKMYGIVSDVPFKALAVNMKRDGYEIHPSNFTQEQMDELEKLLHVSVTPGKIQKTQSPKRPKYLPCDMHHVKITKHLDKVRTFEYLVLVGMMGDDPYEIFVMENGFVDKKHKRGKLFKKSRGNYCVELDDGTLIEDITKDTTETEDVLTRMVSTSLRHGADIAFVVEQLEKSKGDLSAFSKVICRVLKRYIKDGTKVVGEKCPSCGADLIRIAGCKECPACKWTKCE